jgi:putative two-component system response regulator
MMKPKECIMIVEDNQDFGNILLEALSAQYTEYDVVRFKSAAEAVEKIHEGLKPICGWIDIILPDLHGTELSKHILDYQPEAKLIAMTGFTNTELINEALRYGFLDCIAKPFKIDFALEITQSAIERYLISKRKTLLIKDVKMMMEGGQNFQFSSISSLITTLEKQSHVLKNVSLQITELALRLGAAMNLSESDIKILRYAALLYDMGKIPEEEQLDEVKRDSVTTTTFTIFKIILYIIRNIYEWFDGTGFPNQMKGENIPQFSRIISAAYGFIFLSKDRIFQKALSEKEAFEELKAYSGKQYDPCIVEALGKILKKEKRI